MLEFEKEYVCCSCKHTFVEKADFEQGYVIQKPIKCPAVERCNSVKFTCLSDSGNFKTIEIMINC